MGGDDLGSGDEGWIAHVAASDDESSDDSGAAHSAMNDDSRKRKLAQEPECKPKKRKSIDKLLLEGGRHIEEKTAEEQAAFLTSALKHYTLMSHPSSALQQSTVSLLPRYFCTTSGGSLSERLRSVVSLKKLKRWKHVGSPYAIVVCISARRAVAILKELNSLKVRAAKLFPKNASASEQREQLRTTPFGLAVGTPHRMSLLAAGDLEQEGGLSFERTQLVVFDSMLSNKQYSVVSTGQCISTLTKACF